MWDVAVIGGGMAGMASAARLQQRGLSTVVLEAHSRPGGCAGYYCRKGFSFDVGATTLVDFEPGGVGGELLASLGMQPIEGEALDGYCAWLPDRTVCLYRDPRRWHTERLRTLGDTPAHRRFWSLLDRLAEAFWRASRRGVKLPIQRAADVMRLLRACRLRDVALARYVNWTLGDALRSYGLRQEKSLVGLLSILVEDTVHSTIDDAPLINASLGITIRGAGLTRADGGMRGFWRSFIEHYQTAGGQIRWRRSVRSVSGRAGDFCIQTARGELHARQVICAVPATLAARIAPPDVAAALGSYVRRDAESQGGAIVAFLGVPEEEVTAQEFTHHQLLEDYNRPLGDGNNMFISVSRSGDLASAPADHRAVMISTHCELSLWEGLSPDEYQRKKAAAGGRLVELARRVYPRLGRRPVVFEVATPRTYERFTFRPRGAVGGVRQTLQNTNQRAIPCDVGCRGFWLAGDTTWPGLGTVACVLGSRLVAEGVLKEAGRTATVRRPASSNSRRPDSRKPSHALPCAAKS